jgi:hypothetical protein
VSQTEAVGVGGHDREAQGGIAAAVELRHVQSRQERWRRAHMGSAHGIAVRVSSVLKYEKYQASPDITKRGREPKTGGVL